MKVTDYTNMKQINLSLESETKKEVLKELVKILKVNGKIESEREFYQAVLARESEGSTGLGRQIAIPHGKSDTVNELSLVIGRSQEGIDFASLDGKKTKLFFMISDFPGRSDDYLSLLAKLNYGLRNKKLRKGLLEADNKQEFLAILDKF